MAAKTLPKDGSIPAFLKRELTEEAKERMAKIAAEMGSDRTIIMPSDNPGMKRRPFHQPKGMSDEEWAQWEAKKEVEKTPKKEKAEKAPKKERASREGLVSIGDIAKQMGMIPREARGVLRSIKMTKPACGWAWPAGEVEGVKKAITEGKKAPKPKKEATARKQAKIPGPDVAQFSGTKKSRRAWKNADVKKAEAAAAKEEAAAVEAKAKADVAKKVAKVLANTNVKKTKKGGKKREASASQVDPT